MLHSILTIDESGAAGRELFPLFKTKDVDIINVHNTGEALEAIRNGGATPDVIVYALNKGRDEDFQGLKKLKKASGSPTIVISELSDRKYIVRAIEAGAAHYIVKPYNVDSLYGKIAALLGKPPEITATAVSGEDYAVFTFSEMLDREIKAASRGGHPLSILKLNFLPKAGFAAGNEAIEAVVSLATRIIKTRLRITDTAFRLDGRSIFALLPFTDRAGGEKTKEKIKDILAGHTLMKEKFQRYELYITFAVYPEDGKIRRKLMEKLEAAEEKGV